jgi:hypothetical protein
MKRVFAAVVVVACVVGSTPGFARGGFAHGGFAHGAGAAHGSGGGGFVPNPAPLFEAPTPPLPAFENRIPAPLPPPPQAPIINGPCSSGSCL